MSKKEYTEQVPVWALNYLINAERSGLTDDEVKMCDDWVASYADGNPPHAVQFQYGEDEYFASHPCFGLACDVVDATIYVDEGEDTAEVVCACCGWELGKWGEAVEGETYKLNWDGKPMCIDCCEAQADLTETTAADDVGMLINLVYQLRDRADNVADVSTQIPRADMPCKDWMDVGAVELCRLLERKYERMPRTQADSTEF